MRWSVHLARTCVTSLRNQEEVPLQSSDSLTEERLFIVLEELEKVFGEEEVWISLLRQPTPRSRLKEKKMEKDFSCIIYPGSSLEDASDACFLLNICKNTLF